MGKKPQRGAQAAESPSASPTLARARDVWTVERLKRICDRLETGSFLATACRLEGHEPHSLYELMERESNADVRQQVTMARAKGVDYVQTMAMSAEGEPARAARWLLERLEREQYAPPTQKLDAKQAIGGPDGKPLQIVVGSLEELRKLAEGTGDADDDSTDR